MSNITYTTVDYEPAKATYYVTLRIHASADRYAAPKEWEWHKLLHCDYDDVQVVACGAALSDI